MRPPRRLSREEIAVWREVTRTIVPRDGAVLPPEDPEPRPEASLAPAPAAPKPRRATAASYTPPTSTPRPKTPSGLDHRYRKRVERGRVEIDAMLDLHGLTQAQAYGALTQFLLRARDADARLVLVVTGKGRQAAEAGVLRRAVPLWLGEAALRGKVIGFEEAGRSHGGAGALYIRLKRRAE